MKCQQCKENDAEEVTVNGMHLCKECMFAIFDAYNEQEGRE